MPTRWPSTFQEATWISETRHGPCLLETRISEDCKVMKMGRTFKEAIRGATGVEKSGVLGPVVG